MVTENHKDTLNSRGENLKTFFLQLTWRSLILTPVRKSRKGNLFGRPALFELPDVLKDEKALSALDSLANFTANCIAGTRFAKAQAIVCLEGGPVVTKEYRHLPVRRAELLRTARLQAETVLQDDVSRYIVLNYEYHRIDPDTGQLKSILYAVPNALVANIKREFGKRSIRVAQISPPVSGLLNAASAMEPGSDVKAAAFFDLGFPRTRLVLLYNGIPVYQRGFASVTGEIIRILREEQSVGYDEALKVMAGKEFLLTAGENRFGKATAQHISRVISDSIDEVLRTLRVVLSAERLDLDRIYCSGAVAGHPDFPEFIKRLSLDVPVENAEASGALKKFPIQVESEAAVAGMKPSDYFSLNGLMLPQGDTVDFLSPENSRRGSQRTGIFVLAAVTLAAAGLMALQPILYQSALAQNRSDRAALASPLYSDVKGELKKQAELEAQIKGLEKDRGALPFGRSKAAEIYAQVQTQIAPKVVRVTECAIDDTTGTVGLTLLCRDLNQYAALRRSVAENGFFIVAIPFTAAAAQTDASLTCTVTLQVKDFQPFGDSAKQSASSGAKE